jgi:hypothetical protein
VITVSNLVSIAIWCWAFFPVLHTELKRPPSAFVASVQSPGLFDSEDVLQLKISGNIRACSMIGEAIHRIVQCY